MSLRFSLLFAFHTVLVIILICLLPASNSCAADIFSSPHTLINNDSTRLISILDSLALNEKNDLLKRHFESVKLIMQDTTHRSEKLVVGNADLSEVIHFFENEGSKWETYTNGPRPLIMAFASPTDKKNTFYWLILPRSFEKNNKGYSFYMELHGSGGGLNENPRNMLLEPLRSKPAGVTVQGYRKDGLYIYPWGRGDKNYREISEVDIFECLKDFDSMFVTDPQRQYLYGFSMGGGGTFHIAQLSLNRWTAIGMYSAAFKSVTQQEADKFKNIPVWMTWGEKEPWAINDRKLKDYLVKTGAEIKWQEIKGMGHDYRGIYQVELMEWFLKHPVKMTSSERKNE